MFELLTSFLVTLVMAPLILRHGRALGLIDVPNERSMHATPIPRSGGVACILGVAAGCAVAAILGHHATWGAIGVAFAVAILGLVDDRVGLPAMPRLAAQALAGAVIGLLLAAGWWILLGLVVLPTAVNVINFMDGINGITGLSVMVWGGTVALLGVHAGDTELWVIGAVALGAAAGFLPWNAPKAKMFMGDGGSYLFGALVGTGTLVGLLAHVRIGVLIGPMVIYLADTGSSLIRRMLKREAIFRPHRSHTYQRLVTLTGLPHIAVSGFVAALSLTITLSWIVPVAWVGWLITVVLTGSYLLLPWWIGRRATRLVSNGGSR